MTHPPANPPQLPDLWSQGINQRGDHFRDRFIFRMQPLTPQEIDIIRQQQQAQLAMHQMQAQAQMHQHARCDICGGHVDGKYDAKKDEWVHVRDPVRCKGACEPVDLHEAPPTSSGWRYLTRDEAHEAIHAGMDAARSVFFSEEWTGRGGNTGGGNGGG